ncbi:mitochondrial ATPase inhibitor, IATP-domain-containing protein [Terfezia claveryi]|nr:mitochondrial ATPase inhibitor, IATP-domain-containing protein [Terfezia claveryi]
MLRTSINRSASTVRVQRFAPFVISTRAMSSGEVGSGFSRPEGQKGGDSFTKREKAVEDYYIRQKEKEKLLQLREKLKQQRAHLDELDKHIDELTRNQGGEQN